MIKNHPHLSNIYSIGFMECYVWQIKIHGKIIIKQSIFMIVVIVADFLF